MKIIRYIRCLLLLGVMVMSPLGAVKSDDAANGTGLSAEKAAVGEELVGALKFPSQRALGFAKLAELRFASDREGALKYLERAWQEAERLSSVGVFANVTRDIVAVTTQAGETDWAIGALEEATDRVLDLSAWPQEKLDQNFFSASDLIEHMVKLGEEDRARRWLVTARKAALNGLLLQDQATVAQRMVELHKQLGVGMALRPLLLLARMHYRMDPNVIYPPMDLAEGAITEARIGENSLASVALDFATLGLEQDAWETFKEFAATATDTRLVKREQWVADVFFRIAMTLEGDFAWHPLSFRQDDAWHFPKAAKP